MTDRPSAAQRLAHRFLHGEDLPVPPREPRTSAEKLAARHLQRTTDNEEDTRPGGMPSARWYASRYQPETDDEPDDAA